MPDKTKHTPNMQNPKTPSPAAGEKTQTQEGIISPAEDVRPYPEYRRQRRIEDWFPN
jgi:hypothetical protein